MRTLSEGGLYSPDGKPSCRGLKTRRSGFGTSHGRVTTLFEIACKYTPMMSSREEMERLSKRYGVKIEEPICEPGVKIPDPDWSRMEPAHAE